ncbi:MAG: shikimate dehydrogenase [Thermoplasmataceae archaeon]
MKLCGVIGSPITHSKSSAIFNRIFSEHNIDAFYASLDIKSRELGIFVKASREHFCGYNVTAPHKIPILQHLDSMDPKAREIGSVNLVRITDGEAVGYNTDLAGFSFAVRDLDFNGKRILVAGTGGIFRTVGFHILNTSRPEAFHVASREPGNARKELAGTPVTGASKIISMTEASLHQYDVLINCTPIGTFPQVSASPFTDRTIDSAKIGIDVVYNPAVTKFLSRMAANGSRIVTGEDLFVYQAFETMKILFGNEVNLDDVRKILREVMSYE